MQRHTHRATHRHPSHEQQQQRNTGRRRAQIKASRLACTRRLTKRVKRTEMRERYGGFVLFPRLTLFLSALVDLLYCILKAKAPSVDVTTVERAQTVQLHFILNKAVFIL